MVNKPSNSKKVVVLFIFLLVLISATISLRYWQRKHTVHTTHLSGLHAYNNRQWRQAAKNLRHYLAANPDDVQALLAYARSQLNIRPVGPANIQQAVSALRSILIIEANNSDAAHELITLYMQMNMPQKAELIATQYLKADNTDQMIMLAEALARTKRNAEIQVAENLLRKALDAKPDHVKAMTLLAMLLQATGRYAESARLYEDIIQITPDNELAVNNLAWIMCEKLGKYKQSHELAEQALQKNCDCVDFLDTRGLAHYRLGEYEQAVQDFTKCVELSPPKSPSAARSLFHLARTRIAMGRHAEAIEALQQILESGRDARNLYGSEIARVESILRQLLKNNSHETAAN